MYHMFFTLSISAETCINDSRVLLLFLLLGTTSSKIACQEQAIFFSSSEGYADKIISAGSLVDSGKAHPTIAATTLDGAKDLSFGNSGIIKFGSITGEFKKLYATDNFFIAVGEAQRPNKSVFFYKFDSFGAPISNFGSNGFVEFLLDKPIYANDFIVLEDESIVSVGTVVKNGSHHALIVKIRADGTLDTDWGNDGALLLYDTTHSQAFSICKTPTGYVIGGKKDFCYLFVTKLNFDGSVDTSFATEGAFVHYVGNRFKGSLCTTDPSGTLYIYHNNASSIIVTKLSANGAVLLQSSIATFDRFVRATSIVHHNDYLYTTSYTNRASLVHKINAKTMDVKASIDIQEYLSSKACIIMDEMYSQRNLSLQAVELEVLGDNLIISGSGNKRGFLFKTDLNLVPKKHFAASGLYLFPELNALNFESLMYITQAPALQAYKTKGKMVYDQTNAISWTTIDFDQTPLLHNWITQEDGHKHFICPADGIYSISYTAHVAKPTLGSSLPQLGVSPGIAFRLLVNDNEIKESKTATEIFNIYTDFSFKKNGRLNAFSSDPITPHQISHNCVVRLHAEDTLQLQFSKEVELSTAANPGFQFVTDAFDYQGYESIPAVTLSVVQLAFGAK